MRSNKRYYWLKLKDDFFEDDTVAWLEEQENGKDYIIFYLKLCLKSLQDDGKLIRYVGEKLIPYDVRALSKLTNTSADTVAVAMKTFIEIGLIERLESGEIYLTQINEMIGSETDSAKRMRKKRILESTKIQELSTPSQCDTNVQKSDTDIDKDKELDKELKKESYSYSRKKKQKNVDEDDDSIKVTPGHFFENNGFGTISPHIRDQMNAVYDDFFEIGAKESDVSQLIIKALQRSLEYNARSWAYAEKILIGWLNKGYKTIQDVDAADKSYTASKEKYNQKTIGIYNQTFTKERDPILSEEELAEAEKYMEELI